MSLCDPIADMLTRIRNASRVGREQVNIKGSNICAGIAGVLKDEGFIESFDRIEDNKQGIIRVFLKYDVNGLGVIKKIDRYSKCGRRVYSSVDDLPIVMNGMGIAIVSTSKGILSDKKCRAEKVGGEVLCTVS